MPYHHVLFTLTLPPHVHYLQMFETGVDEMSWDDLSQGRNDWPPVRALHEYRQKAYLVIRSVIESHPGLAEEAPRPVGWGDACWAVFMGFEHERIHIETSSVLIREVSAAGSTPALQTIQD